MHNKAFVSSVRKPENVNQSTKFPVSDIMCVLSSVYFMICNNQIKLKFIIIINAKHCTSILHTNAINNHCFFLFFFFYSHKTEIFCFCALKIFVLLINGSDVYYKIIHMTSILSIIFHIHNMVIFM